jgi:general nucleoside transport system ATP-binding protein
MRVELRNIHKTFGTVEANIGIHLTVPAGTIQGILGENGAGKSTLMKVLSGFIHADQGEIVLDGRTVVIHSPADAIRHGIGMLHQDPLDFPPMRVIDNFVIGREGGLFPRRSRAEQDLHLLCEQFGFSLDPHAYVDSLTVGERQQLEILRLLWLGAQVLILDEPTTGISAAQKATLFETLRRLAAQDKTVIFVSHKLEEVEELCHQVAVLRQGHLVGEMKPPYKTKKLVGMMFGKEIKLAGRLDMRNPEVALTLTGLCIEDYRLRIDNLDLEIRGGEVIGLAGMEGSGQAMFLRTCAGLVRPVGGRMQVDGDNLVGKTYRQFLRRGIAYLPAARMEEGLIPGMTLTEHFILAGEQKGLFIDWEAGRGQARQRIEEFSIKGVPGSSVQSLSGGNQQRALLSLLREPLSLLLLEHPTRGLDIESTIYIWGKLKERCRQGTAVIFISSDLEEIRRYSDRILVFFSGRVSPPLEAAKTSVEQLGQLIGGKGWQNIKAEQVRKYHA